MQVCKSRKKLEGKLGVSATLRFKGNTSAATTRVQKGKRKAPTMKILEQSWGSSALQQLGEDNGGRKFRRFVKTPLCPAG